jgi:hypothetical protein
MIYHCIVFINGTSSTIFAEMLITFIIYVSIDVSITA